MTSELVGTAVAAAPGVPEVNDASKLGAGMSHRARSQSVLGRHWSPSGLVGAVGRASVGFGLAVGRSRSIRPAVRFDDLNSAALRPSFELWRHRRSADGGVDDRSGTGSSTAMDGAGGDARDDGAAASRPGQLDSTVGVPIRRIASPASVNVDRTLLDPVLDPVRRRPSPQARPTWTDQIIQRSSIGFVASAPGSAVPEPARPADFVSSGDSKLDQLRLMVREREGTRGAQPAATRRAESAAAGRVERTVMRRMTASEPTVSAGHDAAVPGRLARAMRPERAVASAIPQAQPAAAATRAVSRPVNTPGPSSPVAGARPSPARRTRPTAEPSRVDQLRSLLVEKGILTGEPSTPAGAARPDETTTPPTPASGQAVASRADRPGPVDRPRDEVPSTSTSTSTRTNTSTSTRTNTSGTTSAELRRAATSDIRRTPAPGRDTPAVDSAPPLPASGAQPSAVDRSAPRPSAPSAAGFSESSSPASRLAQTPSTSAGAVVLAERISETSSGLPVTSRLAHQLRAQRLLRSGLVAEASEVATQPSAGNERFGFDLVAEAVPTSSAIESVDAPKVPVIARSTAVSSFAHAPSLAGVDASASTVVRRVTLPRALSSAHRPAPYFASLDDRDLAGAARSAGSTSTVTIARAATSRGLQTDSSATPSGTGRVASRSPLAPAGSSALLDAIRRSAIVERSAPSSPASVDRRRRSVPTQASGADVMRRSDSVSLDDRFDHAGADNRIRPAEVVDVPVVDAPVVAGRSGTPDDVHSPRTELEAVRPAERVAQQFMTVLSETVRRRPAPLPSTLRPLAEAIAGPRPVMLSTDAASRKALRSVGKVAATTGDTIHLDTSAVSAARLDEVMAHELTHIAHPSPAPRFFDDIDDSPEERRAEQIARVMARSPLAPSASTSAPSARRGRDQHTIRRSAAPSTPHGPPSAPSASPPSIQRATSPGAVSAQALAASLTGTGTSSTVVQRWGAATPSPELSRGPQIGSHRADPAPTEVVSSSGSSADDMFSSARSSEWFREQLDENLDRVVRLLEDRMIVELERRGGRTWRQS